MMMMITTETTTTKTITVIRRNFKYGCFEMPGWYHEALLWTISTLKNERVTWVSANNSSRTGTTSLKIALQSAWYLVTENAVTTAVFRDEGWEIEHPFAVNLFALRYKNDTTPAKYDAVQETHFVCKNHGRVRYRLIQTLAVVVEASAKAFCYCVAAHVIIIIIGTFTKFRTFAFKRTGFTDDQDITA